jgi:nucleoside-diphosphate-sugar epimerase
MRILVTGATGFVGRHTVQALLARGHAVTAVYRNEARARTMPWHGRAAGLCADLHALTDAELAGFAAHERILHLAWEGLPNFKDPAQVSEVLPRHVRLLTRLLDQGARHLLVTGTCLEYGLMEGALVEKLPCAPVTAYGQAKDALFRALLPLCRERGAALCWARLFYMHGPGQAEKSLLSQLDRAITAGAASFDMSGGEQLRDYLPVERVAGLLARLGLCGQDFGALNVASGEPVSVRALAEAHLRQRGARLALNLGRYPYPDYEPMRFWADTTQLAAALAACPD